MMSGHVKTRIQRLYSLAHIDGRGNEYEVKRVGVSKDRFTTAGNALQASTYYIVSSL